jgi:hypothetical protein
MVIGHVFEQCGYPRITWNMKFLNLLFSVTQQHNLGPDRLIFDVYRLHADTHTHTHTHTHWKIYQLVAETSTWTIHIIHKKHISLSTATFEPPTRASELSHSYAIDRAATGIAVLFVIQLSSNTFHFIGSVSTVKLYNRRMKLEVFLYIYRLYK